MKTAAFILLWLLPTSSHAFELLPTLTTPSQLMSTGKPWHLFLTTKNLGDGEAYSLRTTAAVFAIHSDDFLVLNSRGERIPHAFGIELRQPSPDWFVLLRPGENDIQDFAIDDGYLRTQAAPEDVPFCKDEEECLRIAGLRLPPDIYRCRWALTNGLNPFTTPEDRAKVWIGEVWSNTLVIQTTEKEPVKVGLDVDPDTLNFKSEGKWITAYLSAPQDADLIAQTTKFQGSIVADKVEWDQGSGAGGQWMIKFPRSLVIDLLKDIRGWELDPSADGRGGMMKVFVSAESGEKMYWGDDKIRILEDPGNAPPSPPGQGNPPSTPPGQDKKKSPRR